MQRRDLAYLSLQQGREDRGQVAASAHEAARLWEGGRGGPLISKDLDLRLLEEPVQLH